jgi:hypothetical protein
MFMAIKKIYGDGVEKLCVYCFLLVLDMVHECLLFWKNYELWRITYY